MKRLLTLGAIALIAIFESCGTAKSGPAIDILTSTSWELTTVNGKPADSTNYNSGLPVANFSTDNKITGNGGCNRYNGSYNINDEGGINISQMASTKMFCPGNGENDYLKALESADGASVENDKLILLKGIEEVLIFKPKK